MPFPNKYSPRVIKAVGEHPNWSYTVIFDAYFEDVPAEDREKVLNRIHFYKNKHNKTASDADKSKPRLEKPKPKRPNSKKQAAIDEWKKDPMAPNPDVGKNVSGCSPRYAQEKAMEFEKSTDGQAFLREYKTDNPGAEKRTNSYCILVRLSSALLVLSRTHFHAFGSYKSLRVVSIRISALRN